MSLPGESSTFAHYATDMQAYDSERLARAVTAPFHAHTFKDVPISPDDVVSAETLLAGLMNPEGEVVRDHANYGDDVRLVRHRAAVAEALGRIAHNFGFDLVASEVRDGE